jgi:hypothetical protein
MQRAAEQAAGWLDYLASDAFVRFRNFAMRQILAIARHLLPRRLKGRLHYGFEDPSLTGRILAGICAVYPVLPGKLTIDPDFERTVLEGEMSFGGHIIPAVILYRSLRIVLHKEFRVLLRRLRGQNEGTKTKKKDGQLSGGIAVN